MINENQVMRLKPLYQDSPLRLYCGETLSPMVVAYRDAMRFPPVKDEEGWIYGWFRIEGGIKALPLRTDCSLHARLTSDGLVIFYSPVDNALRMMKPGKFVAKHFDLGDGKPLPPEFVKGFANYCKQACERYQLSFGTGLHDWLEAYREGPSSCMTRSLEVALETSLVNKPMRLLNGELFMNQFALHPAVAYCTGDFAIATLRDKQKAGKIIARSVCSPARKVHAKVYGDADLMMPMLRKAGYELSLRRSRWIGCKLNAIPSWCDGEYLMPYLDFATHVKLCSGADGKHFEVTQWVDEFQSQRVDGSTAKGATFTCDECMDELPCDDGLDSSLYRVMFNADGDMEDRVICGACIESYEWCSRHNAWIDEGVLSQLHRCSHSGDLFTELERSEGLIQCCELSDEMVDRRHGTSEDCALVLAFDEGEREWQPCEPSHLGNSTVRLPSGLAYPVFFHDDIFHDDFTEMMARVEDLPAKYRERVQTHAAGGRVWFKLLHRQDPHALSSIADLTEDHDNWQATLDLLDADLAHWLHWEETDQPNQPNHNQRGAE